MPSKASEQLFSKKKIIFSWVGHLVKKFFFIDNLGHNMLALCDLRKYKKWFLSAPLSMLMFVEHRHSSTALVGLQH